MNKFFDFIQDKLVPPLVKIGEEKHLVGIRKGLVTTIAFTIVGSIFLIISSFPIPGWEDIVAPYAAALEVPVTVSFGIISIVACIGIGYNLAKEYKIDAISGGLLSLVAFLTTQVTMGEEGYVLNTAAFGSEGLFTAIITAIIAIEIMKFFVKKNLVIRLPENVPPSISNSFVSLVPAGVTITLLWFLHVILGFDFNAFFQMIFSPFVFALNTLPGILVYVFFMCLLWTVGIHGDIVLGAIAQPIFLKYITANTEAFLAGQPIPYITAEGFLSFFINIGGTGATLALVFLMMRSKDETYKSIAKISLPASIFEINEPVIFGFPITFNPIMMIPYVVAPVFLTATTYLLMQFNIIGRPVFVIPWTTPPIIGHFLVTGGDWRATLWGAISIVITVFIYLPFFKAAEKQSASTNIEVEDKGISAK